jgi:hypothetical protein
MRSNETTASWAAPATRVQHGTARHGSTAMPRLPVVVAVAVAVAVTCVVAEPEMLRSSRYNDKQRSICDRGKPCGGPRGGASACVRTRCSHAHSVFPSNAPLMQGASRCCSWRRQSHRQWRHSRCFSRDRHQRTALYAVVQPRRAEASTRRPRRPRRAWTRSRRCQRRRRRRRCHARRRTCGAQRASRRTRRQ